MQVLPLDRLFGKDQGADNTRPVAESGANDIGVHAIRKVAGLYIAVEQQGEILADRKDQMRRLQDAAADNNPLRG